MLYCCCGMFVVAAISHLCISTVSHRIRHHLSGRRKRDDNVDLVWEEYGCQYRNGKAMGVVPHRNCCWCCCLFQSDFPTWLSNCSILCARVSPNVWYKSRRDMPKLLIIWERKTQCCCNLLMFAKVFFFPRVSFRILSLLILILEERIMSRLFSFVSESVYSFVRFLNRLQVRIVQYRADSRRVMFTDLWHFVILSFIYIKHTTSRYVLNSIHNN